MKFNQNFGTEELTPDELILIDGGSWLGDAVEFAGACVGTVIGSALCMAKCLTNKFGITEPKPHK